MERIVTVILAAGKGTRMKSDLVKVLHPLLGLPMLSYTIELSLIGIKAEKTVVVVGHQADRIQERFKDLKLDFALQQEQLGTGHAVLQAVPFLQSFNGTVLILCGDVPLIKLDTLRSFIHTHQNSKSILSVLTAIVEDPFGYGRMVRDSEGWLEKIVEERDASEKEKAIREINTGIYCINASFLKEGLTEIGKENAQGEYYLTDLVGIARKRGLRCSAHIVADSTEVMGINTRVDLAIAHDKLRREKLKELMLSGVTVIDPPSTYVEKMVEVGKDTILYPFSVLQGKTRVGEKCVIESHSKVSDSTLGNEVTICSNSILIESQVEDGVTVSPFSYLRPLSEGKTKSKTQPLKGVHKPSLSRRSKIRIERFEHRPQKLKTKRD